MILHSNSEIKYLILNQKVFIQNYTLIIFLIIFLVNIKCDIDYKHIKNLITNFTSQ